MSVPRSRSGVSMIEIVVVIGILGVLMSILIPAVQNSRAAARLLQCKNNMRQIGLALSQAAEQEGAFPTGDDAFLKLMKFLEQAEVPEQFASGTASAVIPWMNCPDDGWVHREYNQPNYMINDGNQTRIVRQIGSGYKDVRNGFRSATSGKTRIADITDGLSNSAAFSERLVTHLSVEIETAKSEGRRFLVYTEKRFLAAGETALSVDQCRNHRTNVDPIATWPNHAGYFCNNPGYDHLLPPNHVGCYNGPPMLDFDHWMVLLPPSSNHTGGVNILMADGSTHFISNSISDAVWSSLGSINENDVIGQF